MTMNKINGMKTYNNIFLLNLIFTEVTPFLQECTKEFDTLINRQQVFQTHCLKCKKLLHSRIHKNIRHILEFYGNSDALLKQIVSNRTNCFTF